MRKGRFAAIGSLFLLLSVAHCSIPDLPSEGGKCPCAPGYSCDQPTQICVRGDAAASSSTSSAGGSSNSSGSVGGAGTGGAGGAGGTGGQGVGACGGMSPWKEDAGVDWADYTCTFTHPKCDVQSDHVLCCDNTKNVPAYLGPSKDSTYSGQLNSSYSWFVCWVSGQAQQPSGNTIWYYTSLDSPPGNWGYVAGSDITPSSGSTFDPSDPSGTGLPECPCP